MKKLLLPLFATLMVVPSVSVYAADESDHQPGKLEQPQAPVQTAKDSKTDEIKMDDPSKAPVQIAGSSDDNDVMDTTKKQPFKDVTADELVDLKKNNPKLVIIDSRGGDAFDGTVIKGATQLSTADTTEAALGKLQSDKTAPIVFYCTNVNCPASPKAALKATEYGYTNVYEYRGGIDEWKKRGYPTDTIAK